MVWLKFYQYSFAVSSNRDSAGYIITASRSAPHISFLICWTWDHGIIVVRLWLCIPISKYPSLPRLSWYLTCAVYRSLPHCSLFHNLGPASTISSYVNSGNFSRIVSVTWSLHSRIYHSGLRTIGSQARFSVGRFFFLLIRLPYL